MKRDERRFERRETLLVALALGAALFALAYSASRFVQAVFFPDPDPRLVLSVARIGFFWRLIVASYAAAIGTVGAAALRARAKERVDRALVPVVIAAALLCTAQGVFLP